MDIKYSNCFSPPLPLRMKAGQNINITEYNYKIPGIWKVSSTIFFTETTDGCWPFLLSHSIERICCHFQCGFLPPPIELNKSYWGNLGVRPLSWKKDQMCEQEAVSDVYVNERALPRGNYYSSWDSGWEQKQGLNLVHKHFLLSSKKHHVLSPLLICNIRKH